MSPRIVIRDVLSAARRRVRTDGWVAASAAVLAVLPATLIVAWLVAADGAWEAPGAGPLLMSVTALILAGVVGVGAARRWVAAVNEERVASSAELQRGLPPGSLRGVLELSRELPHGTSGALYRRAEAAMAERLRGAPSSELAGPLGTVARRRRRRMLGLAGVLTATALLLGLMAPERARAGWAPLLSPVAHLTPPPLPPLEVEPGNVEVPRGDPVQIRVRAPGRRQVSVHWRATGDVPRSEAVATERNHGAFVLAGVEAPTRYWVTAPDGAVTDTFTVTPLDPLLVSELVTELHYPSYLGLEPERFEGDVPPLELPEGTQLRIRGRATRPLTEASLVREGGGAPVVLDTDGDRFGVRWRPRVDGVYAWRLTDDAEQAAAVVPAPLDLTIAEDLPPLVAITFPAADTVFGSEMRQPVVADARDDHGIAAAELVSWKVAASGAEAEPVTAPIELDRTADRTLVRALLDGNGRRLVPGDAIRYFVRVRDNSPAGQQSVSGTYTIRLPGMGELRRQVEEDAGEMLDDASALAREARALEQATRDLSRESTRNQTPSAGRGSGRPASGDQRASESLGFEQAQEAEQVRAQQQELLDQVEAMRERAEALQRAMEDAGLRDAALQERLQELRELYDQLMSDELRERLGELEDALQELDPDEVQEALERLAREQEAFRERVERSLEVLRRAAVEQQMNALAREAEELATRQQALADALEEEASSGETEPGAGAEADPMQETGQPPGETSAVPPSREPGHEAGEELPQPGADPEEGAEGAGETDAAEAGDRPEQGSEGAERRRAPGMGEQEPGAEGAPQPRQEGAEEQGRQGRQAQRGDQASEQGQPRSRPEQQEALGEQAESLVRSMSELQQRLSEMGEAQAAQQTQSAQQHARSAGQSMEQAAQQASRGESQQAGQSGQRAASEMSQASQTLDAARQAMAESWKQEVQETVQQATQDALSLAQSQESLRQQMEQGQSQGQQGQGQQSGPQEMDRMRAQQSALQQGLQQLGRNLSEAGQRSTLLNQEVGSALGRSMMSMEQTMEAMQQGGNRQMPVREAGRTVEELNRLAMELLENSDQIRQSQSGTGLQQAMQQLAELAQQQGSLNGQASSLMPMQIGQQALDRQLQRLAQGQRQIARRLGGVYDQLAGRDDVLGRLDELAAEADAVARDMGGGRLDPELIARQERLFHRLLDAGRTLEREEYSDERVADRPTAAPASQAGPLDPALLESGLRFPAPTPAQLRDLPPAFRRLILEYFDRLNETDRAGGPGASSSPR